MHKADAGMTCTSPAKDSLPLCIQGLWVGESLSLLEQLSIKSFLAKGYTFHLYVYTDVMNIPDGVVIKDAAQILPYHAVFKLRRGTHDGSYAPFANLFRFKLLYERGGIWSDMDVVCQKQLDHLPSHAFSSEFNREGKIVVNNTFIKIPKYCWLMKACYWTARLYLAWRHILHKEIVWRKSGSDILQRWLKVSPWLQKYILTPQTICPIHWFEHAQLLDCTRPFHLPEDTLCIHLWQEAWRAESGREDEGKTEFDKNRRYSKECLYGYLQSLFL
ncbi:hypothetical protein JW933_08770 [candidate division FCPU426 bacterium]|nr:hypothetical protein [candidate division FCPU426 bacterium]